LIIFTQNINNIRATISHVKLESQMAVHDFLNPIVVASSNFFHFFTSSLILSNISIFASIAIPIDRIKPAMDARVRTIHNVFIIVSTNIIYINKLIDAIRPEALYIKIINIKIIRNHETHA